MHEFSVMSHMLETVEEHARKVGAERVVAINLIIGDRSSIIDDSLLFYFDALTPGRITEGAQLHIERTPTRFYCSECDSHYTPQSDHFRCPTCNTIGWLTSDGSEFLIESIEVEP